MAWQWLWLAITSVVARAASSSPTETTVVERTPRVADADCIVSSRRVCAESAAACRAEFWKLAASE